MEVEHIDDFLAMTESLKLVRNHTLGLILLLGNLGFIVHPEKSITIPSLELEFLGMVVDLYTDDRTFFLSSCTHRRSQIAKPN